MNKIIAFSLMLVFITSCADPEITYQEAEVIRTFETDGGFLEYQGAITYLRYEDGEVKKYRHHWGPRGTLLECKLTNGYKPRYYQQSLCKVKDHAESTSNSVIR